MKKYIILLIINLLSYPLAVISAEQSNTPIKYTDTTIVITRDTIIVVKNLFGDCKLYGDKIDNEKDKNIKNDDEVYTQYGGEKGRFCSAFDDLNNNEKLNYLDTTKCGKGGDIEIYCKNFQEMPDRIRFKFYGALYKGKDKGWCPDKDTVYIVTITKKRTSSGETGNLEQKPEKQNDKDEILDDPLINKRTSSGETENLEQKLEKLNFKGEKLHDSLTKINIRLYFTMAVLIILSLTVVIIVFLLVKLNKMPEEAKADQRQSPAKSDMVNINKIKLDVISKIQSKELAHRISNDDIIDVVNRQDIQLYIKTIIATKVTEYLQNKDNLSATTDRLDDTNQGTQIKQPELRTTDVEYHSDDNCFVISENSQNKIFEIYSINGDYYYTIVGDASIRREMLGFISVYDNKCIDIINDSIAPSTVAVIKDGQLTKDGDRYIIKEILQVSLK